ncbi:MAG: VOC family protein [Acidimicrobiales bacterium]
MFRPRFHLAFGVDDLDAARAFYGGVLGCREGRSDERWVDFDLHGHQVVAHLDDASDATLRADVATNPVDGHEVPAHHFGLVLPVAAWRRLADRLAAADVPFLMEPTTRFTGEIGEQHTLFVTDPAGNALEFKAFVADEAVFCADPSAP